MGTHQGEGLSPPGLSPSGVPYRRPVSHDPFVEMATACTEMFKACTQGVQSRTEGSGRREADTIKIPGLPKPKDIKTWERSVHQAVMAASGHDRQSQVAEWLFVCGKTTAAPDRVFDPESCPVGFASLDTKL